MFFKKKGKGQIILETPINIHWDVESPFTFASHHEDDYPQGNAQMAPPLPELGGRNLGRDYKKHLGYRMYNGKVVPGFPNHAHWGYETVTYVKKGVVDHFDHKGNHGRFANGDVQWVFAPTKYQHCEMYPLVNKEDNNPLDITQIMINLPLKDKTGECSVKTVWSENIPVIEKDGYTVKIICGKCGNVSVDTPDERSWASDPENRVGIYEIAAEPGAVITIPAVNDRINRNIYMVSGKDVTFDDKAYRNLTRFKVAGDKDITFTNGSEPAVFWVLEGVPIEEKQVMFGPVILGTDKEVRDALQDIRKTDYAEWPWDVIDKVHPAETERFIEYSDGTSYKP